MAEQRLEQAAEKTMAIVRSIAGHPDVSVEEAGEILLLAGQRLESARAMSGLNQFSPAEIESAKQFISSLEPAARSKADGFETVQKVLDHYQQMINFTQADEAIIQKVLVGSGVNYQEPYSIKVGRFIRDLGYICTNSFIEENDLPHINFNNTTLRDSSRIGVGKRLPPKKIITHEGFWRTREVVKLFRGDITNLGVVSFGDKPEKDDLEFKIRGRHSLSDSIVIAKYLHDYFGHTVNLTLLQE